MKMKGTNGTPKMTAEGSVKKPKKTKKLEKAETAVEQYENMKAKLLTMRDDFNVTYPKAAAVLDEIKIQEDETQEQINACKILVRDAGRGIGEFTYTHKETTPGYDGAKILELIAALPTEVGAELFKELFQRGVVSNLKIDKAAAIVVRRSDPELRERLEGAWDKGGMPMTAAIGVPTV